MAPRQKKSHHVFLERMKSGHRVENSPTDEKGTIGPLKKGGVVQQRTAEIS